MFFQKYRLLTVPSLLLLVCMVALPQLSETIYSPSLPNIASSLHASMRMTEWTLGIYFAGFALGVSIWGKVSDHIGRRKTMLLGILLYVLVSILCATVVFHIETLLALRFFQAFAISVGSVVTQTIMRECFSGARRGEVFSIIGIPLGVAPAVGPIVGGFLVEGYHWQSNFVLLALLGLLLLAYAYACLPETKMLSAQTKRKMDYSSLFLKMLRDKHIIASVVLVGCLNGIIFSYYAHAPFIFIDTLHLMPSTYGYLGIVLAVASSVGALFSCWAVKRFHSVGIIRFSVVTNVLVMCVFSLLVYFMPLHNVSAMICLIMASMGVFYFLFALAIPNILSDALLSYGEDVGAAGSILGFMYYVILSVVLFGISFVSLHPIVGMAHYFLFIAVVMLVFCFFLRTKACSVPK